MFASTALTPAYAPFAGRRIVRWCPVESVCMNRETVVITGTSRGLGESVARAFEREGAHVVGRVRGEGALKSVAAEIEAIEEQSPRSARTSATSTTRNA